MQDIECRVFGGPELMAPADYEHPVSDGYVPSASGIYVGVVTFGPGSGPYGAYQRLRADQGSLDYARPLEGLRGSLPPGQQIPDLWEHRVARSG